MVGALAAPTISLRTLLTALRFATCLAALVVVGWSPVRAATPKTFFDHLETAWAVGEIEIGATLEFREGRLFAFPAHIVDLIHAKVGEPRTLMLIDALRPGETEPYFKDGDRLLVPIGLLPQHSFWRDNLPNTKHHEVLGGRRYAFRAGEGRELEKAKAVARAYTATFGEKMPSRAVAKIGVVVEALYAGVPRIRDDAVRHLESYGALSRDLDERAAARLGAYIGGDFPETQRVRLALAVGRGGVTKLTPALTSVATLDSLMAAIALESLELLGERQDTERLLELSRAKTPELRAWAAHELGERAAEEDRAFERAVEVLRSQEADPVRQAAATGLGASGARRAVSELTAALDRGDGVSRSAALALAGMGGPEVHGVLKKAIIEGPSEAMIGAVVAIFELRDRCADCLSFLREQYRSHEQEAVRDMIAILLELQQKHEH